MIYLERREPAHNRQRFYTLTVAQTLFGSWTLIREWGRIGHPGTVRETWFESESAAIEAGTKIRRQKEKRGYRAIGGARQGIEGAMNAVDPTPEQEREILAEVKVARRECGKKRKGEN